MARDFQIAETTEDSRPVVRASGELDFASVPELRRILKRSFDAREAFLDLSELTFIDSSGIELLIEATREADANACKLELRNTPAVIRATLRISGVLPLLRFAQS